MSDHTSADIAYHWLACVEVLTSILLDLPLRIELPRPVRAEEHERLVDTVKRTLALLNEEPLASQVDPNGRHHLTQAIGALLLIEEQLQFILHYETEEASKVESWRYQAVRNLVDTAAADLALASEAIS